MNHLTGRNRSMRSSHSLSTDDALLEEASHLWTTSKNDLITPAQSTDNKGG